MLAARICQFVFLAFWLVQFLAVLAETAAAGPSSSIPGVSVVEGRQASFLQHRAVATLRVYAFYEEEPVAIPFQIDERDRRERWVLTHGARPTQDDFPEQFDANDVLVFMNRDLGRRGDPARLPSAASAWAEVRVGTEVNPLGFVYVGVFAQSAPPLAIEQAAARYDLDTDRVYAERYALEFGAPLPTHVAFVDHLGDFGTNAVAGIHAEGEVRFLGGLLTLRRSEKDIQTELLGYRDGPVRVIRRARNQIPLSFGFRTRGQVDLLFYQNFVEGSALVKIAIPPSLVLASGEFQTYFDFLDLSGTRLLVDGEALSEPVNGVMTPEKQALTGRPARWAALLLPDGRAIVFIVRLEGALQKLDQRLYFDDTANANRELGGKPRFGFQFSRVNRLETGSHRLSVFGVVLDSTSSEEIHRTVNIFLSPPEVSVAVVK
jgi:hypothetical protein